MVAVQVRAAGDALVEEPAGRTEERLKEGERVDEPVMVPSAARERPPRPRHGGRSARGSPRRY